MAAKITKETSKTEQSSKSARNKERVDDDLQVRKKIEQQKNMKLEVRNFYISI